MDATLIVYALNLSAIYALMAIGISLLWSSIGMLNMAHGATFAVAGYGALMIGEALIPGLDAALRGSALLPYARFAVLLAAGVGVGAVFGGLIYLLAFLPIHDKANFAVRGLIVTLAINLATVQALLWWFGPRQRALPQIFGFGRLDLFGVPVRYDQAATIAATAVLLAAVLVWLRTSRKGLEIRAMMQNPEGAALSGISVRRGALPVMAVTGAMAGAAAVLLSQSVFVSPTAGAMPLIKGMIIALLGGLGSVPGAALAALLIGALEAATGAIPFLGQRMVLLVQFGFIILVLILRPRGIGGLLDETRK
ncbi:MAG: branched-chain amino acid ABC transporter permease [Gemmobacter sp.]